MRTSAILVFFIFPIIFYSQVRAGLSQAPHDGCEFIRQGLAHLPPEGGRFEIPSGTYTCASPIVLDRDHVTLSGEGTVNLKLADGANSPVIVMGHTTSPIKTVVDLEVSNLRIDGNRDHQQFECWGGECGSGGFSAIRNNGITVRGISDSRILGVYVSGARSGGIVTEIGCVGLTVDHITITDSFFDGFAGYQTTASTFRHMMLFDNRAAGISIDIHFDGNVIEDSYLIGNHDVGIFMRNSSRNIFSNLDIEDSGSFGVFLSSVSDLNSCPVDNEFRDLTVMRSQHAGFKLNTPCAGNSLTGVAKFWGNGESCISQGADVTLDLRGELACQP